MAKKRLLKKTQAVPVVPEVEPKKKDVSKAAIGAALVVLMLITAFEVQAVMKKKVRENKKPVIAARWKAGNGYTGLTSMYNYGSSLYVVDGTRGTMLQYETMTGKFVKKFELPPGLYSMAQLSNGDVLALTAGNALVRFPSGSSKPMAGKVLESCSGVSFIASDSKDNVYAVDSTRNLLVKFDRELKKTAEYGQGKLISPKKAFIGPNDSVYVLDYAQPKKVMVKIFTGAGELKKQFFVLGKKPSTNYESLAVTPEGNLYINNMAGNSIMCYSSDGKLLGSFNSTLDGSTGINSPAGICGGMNGTFVIPTFDMLVLQNIKY